MKILGEFKEFALKGNVIDLAVGVIIGAAFGALVKSVVDDVLMPPLGWLTGGLDFADKAWVMQKAGEAHFLTGKTLATDVVLRWGKFINACIAFFIQAVAIFMLVKVINSARRKPEPATATPPVPPAPTREETLLMEIRDAIRQKAS